MVRLSNKSKMKKATKNTRRSRKKPAKSHYCGTVYGIQGGRGSFNEEAIYHYFAENPINENQIRYLYTSEGVLKALNNGEIDYGQIAIYNTTGGVVIESIEALARYKHRIVNQFSINIAHSLITRKDADLSRIDTIMTHPQVLSQCRNTLNLKYPSLKRISGTGKLIDHSYVAKKLSEGKLPGNIATMGSQVIARYYDLKIVDRDLQDLKDNRTVFLILARSG